MLEKCNYIIRSVKMVEFWKSQCRTGYNVTDQMKTVLPPIKSTECRFQRYSILGLKTASLYAKPLGKSPVLPARENNNDSRVSLSNSVPPTASSPAVRQSFSEWKKKR